MFGPQMQEDFMQGQVDARIPKKSSIAYLPFLIKQDAQGDAS